MTKLKQGSVQPAGPPCMVTYLLIRRRKEAEEVGLKALCSWKREDEERVEKGGKRRTHKLFELPFSVGNSI